MASVKISDGWQLNKNVLERNLIMLERQLYTDVTFVFPDKDNTESTKSLKAHKYMMVASSPVFCAMFTGGLASEGDIIIDDVEYDIFASLLRFIYCEDIQLTGDSVMPVIYAAKKYLLSSLVSHCASFLKCNLDAGNVCMVLDHALQFDETGLAENCLAMIKRNTGKVFENDNFLALSRQGLGHILSSEELSVPEVDVFKACVSWAKAKCDGVEMKAGEDIRRELGDLLYEIRFPTLTTEELSTTVSPTGVLSEYEELACFRSIGNPDQYSESIQTFPSKKRRRSRPIERSVNKSCCILNDSLETMMFLKISGQQQTKVGIKGIRVLCEKGDTISGNISNFSENLPLWQQEHKEIVALKPRQVTSVSYSAEGKYSEVYLSRVIQLDTERAYMIKIKFNYAKRCDQISQQYIKTVNMLCGRKGDLQITITGLSDNRVYVKDLLLADFMD